MKSYKILFILLALVGNLGLQSLEASFEIYGRTMAKDGLSQTHSTGFDLIESVSTNSISIDLNSSTYRNKRALNVGNVPAYPVDHVEFYIDDVKVSEDFYEPYRLYEDASWLPSGRVYEFVVKHIDSNGGKLERTPF